MFYRFIIDRFTLYQLLFIALLLIFSRLISNFLSLYYRLFIAFSLIVSRFIIDGRWRGHIALEGSLLQRIAICCTSPRRIAAYCGLLRGLVLVHCASSRQTDCGPLHPLVQQRSPCCGPLRLVAAYCGPLRLVAAYCGPLRLVAAYCGPLRGSAGARSRRHGSPRPRGRRLKPGLRPTGRNKQQ